MREYLTKLPIICSLALIVTIGLAEAEPEDVDLVGLGLRHDVGEDGGVLL